MNLKSHDIFFLFQAEFYLTALKYYYEQLTVVLESFNSTLDDLGLPNTFPEFASLVKRCLVLEFIVVTVVKPIMMIPEPEKLLKWHKETEKNKIRRFKKKVVKPEYNEVFTSPRFTGFCHLYFKIATALGAFQVCLKKFWMNIKLLIAYESHNILLLIHEKTQLFAFILYVTAIWDSMFEYRN